MNKKELKQKLDRLGIRENYHYSYSKENADMTVLSQVKKWEVYDVDEMSNKYEGVYFDTEDDEACDYLYQKMVRFKWVMDNAHIHPNNKPKIEDVTGFEVMDDGIVNAIIKV